MTERKREIMETAKESLESYSVEMAVTKRIAYAVEESGTSRNLSGSR